MRWLSLGLLASAIFLGVFLSSASTFSPKSQSATLQVCGSSHLSGGLLKAFGDAKLSRNDQAQAKRITKTTYAKAWDANRGLLADTPSHASYSEHANILGVLTDAILLTSSGRCNAGRSN